MKMNKALLVAWVAITSLPASAIMAQPATASVYYQPYATQILLNGQVVSNPSHIIAKEYPTADPTSWIPIYFLQTALRIIGIQNAWDGYNWNLQVPQGWTMDLSNLPSPKGHTSSSMAIQINGQIVEYAPRIAYKEPGATDATSYAPIW